MEKSIMHVVIFRGFGGHVFSTGMDRLCEKLSLEHIPAVVTGYEQWAQVYTKLLTKPRPIVLIGHSFGALAAYKIVSSLPGQTFPLVVTFDYSPYYSGLVAHAPDGVVPDNVTKALNFYQDVDPLVRGVEMERSDGTKRNITNVLTKYAHVEIDKADELHQQVIDEIRNLQKKKS
jgi:pimeloyl-ACP methyl ester carboxylesterase